MIPRQLYARERARGEALAHHFRGATVSAAQAPHEVQFHSTSGSMTAEPLAGL